ncbi:MAG: CAP domain-containing protein, partial [Anaerolineae bacterium]
MRQRPEPVEGPFEAVLGACLDALFAGATVEACLTRYPDQAGKLEPLLRLAGEIAQTPTPRMPRAGFEYGRRRVRDAVTAMRDGRLAAPMPPDSFTPEQETRSRSQIESTRRREEQPVIEPSLFQRIREFFTGTAASPLWSRAIVTISVVLLLFGAISGVVVQAAEGSLPGDPLYPVKRVTRQVQLLTALNPEVRQAKEKQIQAQEREEVQQAAEQEHVFQEDVSGVITEWNGHSLVLEGSLRIQVTEATQIQGQPMRGHMANIVVRSEDGQLMAERITILPRTISTNTATVTLTNTVTPTQTPPPTNTSKPTQQPIQEVAPIATSTAPEMTDIPTQTTMPSRTLSPTPRVTSTPSITPSPSPTHTPTEVSAPPPTHTPTATEMPISTPDPLALINVINRERQRRGLSALRVNPSLMAAAQTHSTDLATHNHWGHTGTDGSTPQERMRRAGYPLGAGEELLAANSIDVDAIVQFWLRNPEYQSALMNVNYVDIGAGYAYDPNTDYRDYWTVLVARPVATPAPTETPTDTPWPTETPTPTNMASPTPSATDVPSATPTPSPTQPTTPSLTPSPTPTASDVPSVPPPSPTPTPAGTEPPIPTATPTATSQSTTTPTATITPVPTETATPTATFLPTDTPPAAETSVPTETTTPTTTFL